MRQYRLCDGTPSTSGEGRRARPTDRLQQADFADAVGEGLQIAHVVPMPRADADLVERKMLDGGELGAADHWSSSRL